MKDFKYTINGTQYKVEVVKENENSVELEVNGTPYVVEIERTVKVKPHHFTSGSSSRYPPRYKGCCTH
jgi:hypothetical protein